MDTKYGIYLAAVAAVMLSACSETSEEPILAQLGESCNDTVLCSSDLVCVDGICAKPSDDKKAGLGEACSDTVICETGLVCTNSVCTKAGECTTDNDCTDAKCVDGKCVPNQKVDCKNGIWETDKCICNDLFKTDQAGICTLCMRRL